MNKTAEMMNATITISETKAQEYYYKLWKCLRKALSDDKLACHCNSIVVQLGKSVESGFTYYNAAHDIWCDYFLR